MIVTVRALRVELAAAITAAELGVAAYDKVNPAAELPCAVVWWPERIKRGRGVVFDPTLAGHEPVEGRVTTYVSMADELAAQDELDRLLTAIPEALEARTSAVWQSLKVLGIDEIRETSVGESTALAFDTAYEALA